MCTLFIPITGNAPSSLIYYQHYLLPISLNLCSSWSFVWLDDYQFNFRGVPFNDNILRVNAHFNIFLTTNMYIYMGDEKNYPNFYISTHVPVFIITWPITTNVLRSNSKLYMVQYGRELLDSYGENFVWTGIMEFPSFAVWSK